MRRNPHGQVAVTLGVQSNKRGMQRMTYPDPRRCHGEGTLAMVGWGRVREVWRSFLREMIFVSQSMSRG